MTKDELIALAGEGKAHIEVAYTIARYCVTPNASLDYEAIFLSISNEDGSVYDDEAYFTDGVDEIGLTDDEAESVRLAIQRGPVQP
jgi:hypothetical protein